MGHPRISLINTDKKLNSSRRINKLIRLGSSDRRPLAPDAHDSKTNARGVSFTFHAIEEEFEI